MAIWYCSSAAYATVAVFVPSAHYEVGDLIKPTSPSASGMWVLRCTSAGVAGGTEPGWAGANNATTTTGFCVFTNVTGQSTYGWAAAAGSLGSLTNQASGGQRALGGDTVYLSSDHSETSVGQYFTLITSSVVTLNVISVNRAGSVPPTVSDLQAGAILGNTASSTIIVDRVPLWFWGVNINAAGLSMGGGTAGIGRRILMDSSALAVVGGSSGAYITTNAGRAASLVLRNTTVSFSNAGQAFRSPNYNFDILWENTQSALLGTVPTALFVTTGSSGMMLGTCRGVDLSSLTTALVASTSALVGKFLFEGCKINSGVTPFTSSSNAGIDNAADLVGCYDGTNVITGRYNVFGSCVVNRTTTTTVSPSTDDTGAFSQMLATNSDGGYPTQVIECFPFDSDISAVGSPLTATVEVVSSVTLTNADLVMNVEYLGTAGSSATSFVSTAPATPLTTPTNLTLSSATWNSPPGGAVYQKLAATFTPQQAGRCRITIALTLASTTVYINSKASIG